MVDKRAKFGFLHNFGSGEGTVLKSLSGYQLGPTMQGPGQATHAQFSADGKRVATTYDYYDSENNRRNSTKVWDVNYPAGNLVHVACSLLKNSPI